MKRFLFKMKTKALYETISKNIELLPGLPDSLRCIRNLL
jgi:hypothetical protein